MESTLVLASQARTATGPDGMIRPLLQIWSDPANVMMRNALRYGDIFRFRFPFVRYYVVADPEGIKHVLVYNYKNYVKSRNYRGLKIVLGDGLLTAEGDVWRRQRKLTQPGFHRERLSGFVSTMSECTKDMLDRWDGESDAPTCVHAEMMRLTFRIIGRTLLSAELDGDAKSIGEALNVAIRWANEYGQSPLRFPPWVPTPNNIRFNRARRVIEDVVLRTIRTRRETAENKDDLLAMLMEARDEEGRGMTDRELRHELLTLVLAGHETTANALTFTLYLLSKYPAVLVKLAREVEEVLGGRAPALADLPRLSYTTQVIEEAMRLYPPAWVMERDAIEDDVVCGVFVPKGSIVGVSPYVTHRLPRLWPNPEGFDPERFTKENKELRHKHAYLPFGGGPRTCIGNAFAMMEMQVVLPMIVQRYLVEMEPGFEVKLDASITLRPANGVPMRRRRRARALS